MPSPTLREAVAALRRTPLLTGLSAAMVALALFVLGLFSVATHNLQLTLQSIEERVQVVAFVQDGTPASALDEAATQLKAYPEVADVAYVSKEQAHEIARREMPEIGVQAAGLDVNPFPASLEIRLAEGFTGPEAVARVAEYAGEFSFVERTRFGEEWVGHLYNLRRLGGAMASIIGGAFAVVGALIIGAAIRIAIFARRDEIYIMRLVGARDGFIRRPFLLEGAFTGAIGGVLATLLTWSIYQVINRWVVTLEWVPVGWVISGVGAGALFGMIASAIAVRRHLQEV